MKKIAMALAAFALVGVAAYADNTQKNQVVAAAPKAAVKLSADEQAFAAKLSEQNRGAFNDKLTAEQRQAAMVAVKNGANADEAVQHMLTAQAVKSGVVADAATPEAAHEAVK